MHLAWDIYTGTMHLAWDIYTGTMPGTSTPVPCI